MANRNFSSGGKIYSMHTMPVLIDCNFVVDATNGNGLGIRSLKGPLVQNVFMHTSAPLAGSGNPNPAPGTIVIQLQDNYNRSLSGFSSIVASLSAGALQIDAAALTAGVAYVITVVGDATAAQWQAVGVPPGVTPALGVAFIALNTGAGGGTLLSRVNPAASSASTFVVETVGDPNQTLSPNPNANQGFGGQIILRCRSAASDITPANGTVISIAMYLNNSSILVQGE